MLTFFRKNYLPTLLAFLLCKMPSSLMADECFDPCNRFYIGAFGGGLYSDSTQMVQMGTIFFLEAAGGPLAVDARGYSGHNSTGFGGVQMGYEWLESPYYIGCSDFCLTSALEVEAYWYKNTKRGELLNSTDRLVENNFADAFPMNVGVYLFNGVFTLNNCCFGKFSPYVGGGIGVASISIHDAESLQISPSEPGVNHFNSKRSDSSFAFAAQAKAGLRYNVYDRFHLFGEYRFLYLDSSRYIFGSTVFAGHAPSTPWNVDIKNMCSNAFAFGLQFDL